jgi:multidrug efflux pump subunit AcrB
MLRTALVSANARLAGGALVESGRRTLVETGYWIGSADDVGELIVRTRDGAPIRVRDVSRVVDADAEPDAYVTFYHRDGRARPAVTVSISKRRGTNAIDIASRVEEKLATVRGSVLPSDLNLAVTRNYGETARDKSNELLWHMLLAVLSVAALIWIALGRREAAVVMTAIPVTLA